MNLNYKNYKVVIVDDVSIDGTYELLQQLIKTKFSDKPITLIRNQKRMTAVYSYYRAIMEHCAAQDIIVTVDGDDQLLVKDALKVFNTVYQQQNVEILYSNHIQIYWHLNQVHYGWSSAFTDNQKKNNLYRDVPQRISHLRSFKASIYRKIKLQDFKDQKGEWLQSTADEVMYLPIFELSCGRIGYIQQYFYLYNFGTGANDYVNNKTLQDQVTKYVRRLKRYQCQDK